MVTFCMKVVLKLSVWALRACSYKTKAKDWAAGHRPPSSSRGLSWFLSCFQQWFDGFKGFKRIKRFKGLNGFKRFKRFKRFNGIILTTVFLFSPFLCLTISHPHHSHAHA